MKKFILLLTVFTITLTAAGCGGQTASVTADQLELSIFNYGMAENNNWKLFDKAAELTGVKVSRTVSETVTDIKQAFNIMIASGNLSDIIVYTNSELKRYGMEGALIPLNDLIDKYAPHIKKFLEERPDVRRHITALDGNIYDISFVMDGEVSEGWFVRQDWLDKLGLRAPTNIDELYGTLKAFAERDPNGNSKKDEVPFFQRHAGGGGIMRIAPLLGANTGWYEENGTVKYGPSEQIYFDTVLMLSKWYAEKLIDQEIFTRGNKARDELLGNDQGGMTHDWFVSTAQFNDKLAGQIDGFNFVPMLPPADANGVVKENTARNVLGITAWGISHSNKQPEETIKYFDFWFTEEGRRLANFGIEGEHYTVQNGKPVFADAILNSNEPLMATLQKDGVQCEFGYVQDFWYEEQGMNAMSLAGVQMYKDIVPKTLFPSGSLNFTDGEQRVVSEKLTAVTTFIEETRQSIIIKGNTGNMTYDKYKATIDGMGLSEVTGIYQAAYDRYMK